MVSVDKSKERWVKRAADEESSDTTTLLSVIADLRARLEVSEAQRDYHEKSAKHTRKMFLASQDDRNLAERELAKGVEGRLSLLVSKEKPVKIDTEALVSEVARVIYPEAWSPSVVEGAPFFLLMQETATRKAREVVALSLEECKRRALAYDPPTHMGPDFALAAGRSIANSIDGVIRRVLEGE